MASAVLDVVDQQRSEIAAVGEQDVFVRFEDPPLHDDATVAEEVPLALLVELSQQLGVVRLHLHRSRCRPQREGTVSRRAPGHRLSRRPLPGAAGRCWRAGAAATPPRRPPGPSPPPGGSSSPIPGGRLLLPPPLTSAAGRRSLPAAVAPAALPGGGGNSDVTGRPAARGGHCGVRGR